MRCAVAATDLSLDASTRGLIGLAGIAANVQLKAAEAQVTVSVIGLRGDQGAIPEAGELSVKKFGEINAYVNGITRILNADLEDAFTNPDSRRRADPKPIAIETVGDADLVQTAWCVGVVWALHGIAEGWQHGVAMSKFPMQQAGPQNPRPDAAITATYARVLGKPRPVCRD